MFKNRREAGKLLAVKIKQSLASAYFFQNKSVVLGIPKGGVIVAQEIAKGLKCPLDIIVVKKIGAPDNNELAIGAVGENKGSFYLNKKLAQEVGANKKYLEQEVKLLQLALKRQEKVYRHLQPPFSLENKMVIIADDGAATRATIISAAREVWNHKPKKVVFALPALAKETLILLEKEADEVIYLEAPDLFYSVSQFYENFPQINEDKVKKTFYEYHRWLGKSRQKISKH